MGRFLFNAPTICSTMIKFIFACLMITGPAVLGHFTFSIGNFFGFISVQVTCVQKSICSFDYILNVHSFAVTAPLSIRFDVFNVSIVSLCQMASDLTICISTNAPSDQKKLTHGGQNGFLKIALPLANSSSLTFASETALRAS